MHGIIRISKIIMINESDLLIFNEKIFSEILLIQDVVIEFQVRTSKTNIKAMNINRKGHTNSQLDWKGKMEFNRMASQTPKNVHMDNTIVKTSVERNKASNFLFIISIRSSFISCQ